MIRPPIRQRSRLVNSLLISAACGCLAGAVASAENWPGWRGPEGTGISPATSLPLKFDAKQNVKWRIELPAPGNSSPIVWGDRVFVTQATPADHRRTLMCFDAAEGKPLWQSGVSYAEDEPTHPSNPYCSATPVTDGQRVIAFFGSAGLYCYDFAGKELWHRELGRINHQFGSGSSPILWGELCILNFGPGPGSRLVAVKKETGEVAWEVQPPKVDPGEIARRQPGPDAFGMGMFLAPQMMTQADKDGDEKLTRNEFVALADAWFDKLDADKSGKLTRDQFVERLHEVLPPPQGFGPGGGGGPRGGPPRNGPGRGGPPGGGFMNFSPDRMVAPGLFDALDADKDSALTRDEVKTTFTKWFEQWDKGSGVDEDKLREGLNSVLPRPQFGPPGGPGGPGGPPPGGRPGRGPGGPGGPPRGPGGMAGFAGSWSTPIIVHANGHDELVVPFQHRLAAYDKDGKQLWISKGLGDTIYASPLWDDGLLVAMSNDMGGGTAVALKPGAGGDVKESDQAWHAERVKSGIGSGVIQDGLLFIASMDGIVTCHDMKTGSPVWHHRLPSTGDQGGTWSSMLLADGKIYLPNQSGDVVVLRAGRKFEALATNSVGEPTNASLAASDGRLFLRTDKALWCFADVK